MSGLLIKAGFPYSFNQVFNYRVFNINQNNVFNKTAPISSNQWNGCSFSVENNVYIFS